MLTNILNRKQKPTINELEVQVAVEYDAPYWVVYVADPGTQNFKPVRDNSRQRALYDKFGNEKSKFAPIKPFNSTTEVQTYVEQHIPNAKLVKRKKPGLFSFATPAAE